MMQYRLKALDFDALLLLPISLEPLFENSLFFENASKITTFRNQSCNLWSQGSNIRKSGVFFNHRKNNQKMAPNSILFSKSKTRSTNEE